MFPFSTPPSLCCGGTGGRGSISLAATKNCYGGKPRRRTYQATHFRCNLGRVERALWQVRNPHVQGCRPESKDGGGPLERSSPELPQGASGSLSFPSAITRHVASPLPYSTAISSAWLCHVFSRLQVAQSVRFSFHARVLPDIRWGGLGWIACAVSAAGGGIALGLGQGLPVLGLGTYGTNASACRVCRLQARRAGTQRQTVMQFDVFAYEGLR